MKLNFSARIFFIHDSDEWRLFLSGVGTFAPDVENGVDFLSYQ